MFPDVWKYWKESHLVEVELLHGVIDGDHATLFVRGKHGNGDPVRGPVRMVRQDGTWRFQRSQFTSVSK